MISFFLEELINADERWKESDTPMKLLYGDSSITVSSNCIIGSAWCLILYLITIFCVVYARITASLSKHVDVDQLSNLRACMHPVLLLAACTFTLASDVYVLYVLYRMGRVAR